MRRQSILKSAEFIFEKYGFANTSVSAIVAHSNIARGTFYSYFSGKREVFYALLENFFSSIDKAIFYIDIYSKDTPFYQIKKNITNLLTLVHKKKKLTKIILAYAYGVDKETDSKIDAFYKEIINLIEHALIEGIKLNIVRPCNTNITALCIIGSIKELAGFIINNKITSKEADDVVDNLLDFALKGLSALEYSDERVKYS